MSDTNGTKTQVYFILIRNKWKNSVNNCETSSNFSSIGSDHRIVTVTIRLSLRSIVKQNKRKIYDWSILKDKQISKEYSNTVKLIYHDLNTESTNTSATGAYEHFIKANGEAAASLIHLKIKPRDKIISQDSRISELRNDVQAAYKEYSVLNTNDSQEKLSKAKQLLHEEYDNIEAEILDSNIKHI